MAAIAPCCAMLCRRDHGAPCGAPALSARSIAPLPSVWWSSRRLRSGIFVAGGGFWPDLSQRPMSVEMEEINGDEALDEALRQSQEHSRPIVIDWMASWCRKCIYLKPKVEKLAAEFYPRIKFYFVDVNKVPQSLVKRGNITKMPTIQLWKDGEWRAEVIGGHKAWLVLDEVRDMIQKNL